MGSSQAVEEVEGLSSPRCSRTALLRCVCVCVTEHHSATSNYLEPLHARKVARAVERQLELVPAQSLLRRRATLPPRVLPQTVDQLKVSWVGVLWRWVMVVHGGSLSWGTQPRMVIHANPRFETTYSCASSHHSVDSVIDQL